MYAGTTLKGFKRFDAWFGVHQKVDRAARGQLNGLLSRGQNFPGRRELTRFEGIDGPDGIKRKTPGQGEPWHFIDPADADDRQLVGILQQNYDALVQALREGNQTRAAFEAAWLAHGIVDGLTPAHHYPYEDELVRLRGGGNETRTTTKDKLLMPGEGLADRVHKNWGMWGDKGLLSTHLAFEIGVAVLVTTQRFTRMPAPDEAVLEGAAAGDWTPLFLAAVQEIAALHLYDEFYRAGWTPRLARTVRRELLPLIVRTVTTVWCLAAREAYGA